MEFAQLNWHPDRLKIGDWVFRIEYNKDDAGWELGEHCFPLIKNKELMDSYAEFFSNRPQFRARNIVEIGMFAGGSIALWNEILKPAKLVGIDIQSNQENDYYRSYIAKNNLYDSIRTFWNTDQSDKSRLKAICMEHMEDGIDLVFDDASHLYGPTKQSFEALFPLLRPGGLYIIEDWSWGHSPAFQKETSIWRNETALTQLIFELVEAVGSSRFIADIHIFNNYTVIEKSQLPLDPSSDFSLDQIILRRPEIKQVETASPSSGRGGIRFSEKYKDKV